MGAATRHRQKFLSEHKRCAFCGGRRPATTIEHCPPRTMFRERRWPEGFEFPACEECNGASSDHDLLVGLLARFADPNIGDGRFEGMLKLAERQYPGLHAQMNLSTSEARRLNRELGIKPSAGQTQQELGGVRLPPQFNDAVCVVAAKLGKGIYYNQTRRPFPVDGCILLHWFTNTELIKHGQYPVFAALRAIDGIVPVVKRQRNSLTDQFEYKLSASSDYGLLAIQAKFFNSFGLVIVMGSQSGTIETLVGRLRGEDSKPFPFAVLQSAVDKTSNTPKPAPVADP